MSRAYILSQQPTLMGISPDSQYNIVSCLSLYDFPSVKQLNKYFNVTINPVYHYKPTHLLFNVKFKYKIILQHLQIEPFIGAPAYEHYMIEKKEDYRTIVQFYESSVHYFNVNIFEDLKFYCTANVAFETLKLCRFLGRLWIDMKNVKLVINGENYKAHEILNYINIRDMDIFLNSVSTRNLDGVQQFKDALQTIANSDTERASIIWVPANFKYSTFRNKDGVYDLLSTRSALIKQPKFTMDEPNHIGVVNHCIQRISEIHKGINLSKLFIPQISHLLAHHKPQLLALFPKLGYVMSNPIDLYRTDTSDTAIWRGVDVREHPIIKCGVTLRTETQLVPVVLEDIIEILKGECKPDSLEDVNITGRWKYDRIGGYTVSLFCSYCSNYTTFMVDGYYCVDCLLEDERLALLDHVSESDNNSESDSEYQSESQQEEESSTTHSPTPSELGVIDPDPVRRLSARNMVATVDGELFGEAIEDLDYVNERVLPDEDEEQELIQPINIIEPPLRRSTRVRYREEANNEMMRNYVQRRVRRRLRSNSQPNNNN